MTRDITQHIAKLSAELEEHLYRYYILADPNISDQEFDRLLAELQGLEEAHPNLKRPDSPTQRIGGAPTYEFSTVRHAHTIAALDNGYLVETGDHETLIAQNGLYARMVRAQDISRNWEITEKQRLEA
ncbi:MAG: hypothetical protein QGG64_13175 [Candidatus Latescibacteria bacterium]|nr:hypothetical protein [Candidatus Latescibacterota bacterium]